MELKPKISYTVTEAAEATGYSKTVIYDAIRAGDLTLLMGTRGKGVIAHGNLVRWVDSFPAKRAGGVS